MRSCMFLGNGGGCFSLFVLLLQVQNRLYLVVGLFAVLCVLESGRWPVDVGRHCLRGIGSFVLCEPR